MAQTDGDFWVNKQGKLVHKANVPMTQQLKDELVEKLINKAQRCNKLLKTFKNSSLEAIEEYYKLLLQEYRVDERSSSKKGNLTIENYSATAKITLSVSERIAFDEKLQIAKTIIDEYLHEVTKNAPPEIQTLITNAFDVDKKGEVNAKKIIALKGYDIPHPKWIKAMKIIDEATEIISSTNYIRFYARNNREDNYKLILLDLAKV